MLAKEYCCVCGAPITNVEDWLLCVTPGQWKCRACFYQPRADVEMRRAIEDTSKLVWPNDGKTQCDACQLPVEAPDRKDRPSYCGLPHYGECAFFVPKQKKTAAVAAEAA